MLLPTSYSWALGELAVVGSSVSLLVAGLAAVATAFCGMMLWRGGREAGMPGCGAKSGCGAVTRSRWAKFGPLPVAGLGMLLYGVLAGAAGLAVLGQGGVAAEGVVTVVAVTAGGAAVWFVGLQLVVLRKVCLYCMMLQGLGLVIAGSILAQGVPGGWIGVGGVGVAGLVGGQILLRPRMYRVRKVEALPEEPATALPSRDDAGPMASPALQVVAERNIANVTVKTTVRLVAGRAILGLADWPRMGPADARHVVGLLFDPTCPACWEVYGVLQKAVEEPPGELAVLMVPVPLDSACNPRVKSNAKTAAGRAGHEGACAYVRLALALWRAKPEAWEELGRWCQGRATPAPLAEVRAMAQRWAGAVGLTLALTDPTVEERVREAVRVYWAVGIEELPQVLMGKSVLQGRLGSAEELWRMLDGTTRSSAVRVGRREAARSGRVERG